MATLNADQKRTLSASELVRLCPHAPEDTNPCPCGIRWGNDGNGGWYIVTRWADREAGW